MDTLQLFVVLFVINATWGQASRLSINISTDNSFIISLSGQEWFRSGPVEVRNKGEWLRSSDNSLILNGSHASSGQDALGPYNYLYFEYYNKPGRLRPMFKFTAFLKVYYKIDAIVFGHRFDSGAEGTAADSADDVISSFPSILVEDSPLERGYVTFEGNSKLNWLKIECSLALS